MHPVYRRLIVGILCVLSLVISLNKCQQRQNRKAALEHWGPELDRQMYDVFYLQASKLNLDEEAKAAFANCCLNKMKKLFPDGISNIQNQMTDSMKVAFMKMGVECAPDIKKLEKEINIWQPELVKQFKLQLYAYPETKMLPESLRAEYVDCITFKVMAKFPNGPASDKRQAFRDYIQKTRNDCVLLLVNKHPKASKSKRKLNN